MLQTVGDVMADERKARRKAEAEIAVLRQELQAMKSEVAELRGELKAKSAIAEMESRLQKLESPRLRAAS